MYYLCLELFFNINPRPAEFWMGLKLPYFFISSSWYIQSGNGALKGFETITKLSYWVEKCFKQEKVFHREGIQTFIPG